MHPRSIAKSFGRRLVRSYPQPWRERYEGEVLALLDETNVRWRDVADLARGLLVERARSVFEPGDHPYATFAAMEVCYWGLMTVMMTGGLLLGWAARAWIGPIPRWAGVTASMAIGVIALIYYFKKAAKSAQHAAPDQASFRRVGFLGIAVMGTTLALLSWAKIGSYLDVVTFGMMGTWFHGALQNQGIWRRMHVAIGQLIQYRHDIKWAKLELERCEHLETAGMTSPIEEARANLDRVKKSGEKTFATLHGMGYRARFKKES
jgi:hypothetical protein